MIGVLKFVDFRMEFRSFQNAKEYINGSPTKEVVKYQRRDHSEILQLLTIHLDLRKQS